MSNPSSSTSIELATLGGGCFWCLDAVFQTLKGVVQCETGYSGGQDHPAPTYDSVCTDTTGHAEVIRVEFQPEVISYEQLLTVFFASHNPTTLNRQGHDVGTQYRSAVFYHSPEQQNIAATLIKQLSTQQIYLNPIVTELTPVKNFFRAEIEHQQYFKRHPNESYCLYVIKPKINALQAQFQTLQA